MKKELPIALTFISAFVLTVQYFVPHRSLEIVYEISNIWLQVIGIFAIGLGIFSLIHLHYDKIRQRKPYWGYSLITLGGLAVTTFGGLFEGIEEGGIYRWLYDFVLNPVSASMFSLLAFFIASAAYRAFRARSMVATILLLSAVIVMLGRVPVGDAISGGWLSRLADWLLNVPNVAAKRAILIGLGLGGAAMALRVMLGIERSYMGNE